MYEAKAVWILRACLRQQAHPFADGRDSSVLLPHLASPSIRVTGVRPTPGLGLHLLLLAFDTGDVERPGVELPQDGTPQERPHPGDALIAFEDRRRGLAFTGRSSSSRCLSS